MKTLFLIRHAKSSWSFDLKDHDRPLGKRGRRDVLKIGKHLLDINQVPDRFITSTASRALYTALHMADIFKVEEKEIELETSLYHASPKEVLALIKNSRECDSLAIFGHNPGFTETANALANQHFDNIPTCGVVGILFDVERWQEIDFGKGQLAFTYFPKTI